MRRGHAWRGAGQLWLGERYVVEGQNYGHADSVHREAVRRGFTGCLATTSHRLAKGAKSWAELLAPLQGNPAKRSRNASEGHQRKRAEMAATIEALDARKNGGGA